jgi:hypothetical protein
MIPIIIHIDLHDELFQTHYSKESTFSIHYHFARFLWRAVAITFKIIIPNLVRVSV